MDVTSPLNVNIKRWMHHADGEILQIEAMGCVFITVENDIGQPHVLKHERSCVSFVREDVIDSSSELAARGRVFLLLEALPKWEHSFFLEA